MCSLQSLILPFHLKQRNNDNNCNKILYIVYRLSYDFQAHIFQQVLVLNHVGLESQLSFHKSTFLALKTVRAEKGEENLLISH